MKKEAHINQKEDFIKLMAAILNYSVKCEQLMDRLRYTIKQLMDGLWNTIKQLMDGLRYTIKQLVFIEGHIKTNLCTKDSF